MGSSLSEYLAMKIHPDISGRAWSNVLVKGVHQRDPARARLSPTEKKDKPFNWQRPTQCFPGADYMQHYAAITATYLSLKEKPYDHVRYILPSQSQCLLPFLRSNLWKMGPVDIVIVGYFQDLERWTQGPWDSDEITNYSLGRPYFWGDIAGDMVRALRTINEAKCVLYAGKLGSLHAEHVPNHWLATGCKSMVRGQLMTWKNPLEPMLQYSPSVALGVHCTSGSVSDETKDWLESVEQQYDFVDPEIGHMAKAAMEEEIEFGYLHIISDYLAKKYVHDLSNERLKYVLQERKKLVKEIQDVLGHFFDQWVPRG